MRDKLRRLWAAIDQISRPACGKPGAFRGPESPALRQVERETMARWSRRAEKAVR